MKRLLVSTLVCVVAACGNVTQDNPDGGGGGGDGGGGDDAETSDFTISVDQTSLTLPIATSATVAITIVRTGQVGDVTLTAQAVPANLSVTFEPATLPEGTNAATATVTAIGGMAPGTGSFSIHASGGGAQHDATVSVTTTAITVTGKVRGELEGVAVGLVGKPSTTSGAGGVFTFTDVIPPYDLYTYRDVQISLSTSDPKLPVAYFFDDLTRTDPEVSAPSDRIPFLIFNFCAIGVRCNVALSGARSGAGNNSNPMLVGWSRGGTQVTTTGSYAFTARANSNAAAGSLYALQYSKNANQMPSAFFYGKTDTTLTADAQVVNVTLAAATTATTTGTLVVPAGFPTPTISMTQQFESLRIDYPTVTTANVAGVIPALGANFATSFFASSSAGGATTSYSHPLNGTNVDLGLTMLTPSQQSMPVASATGVNTTTSFSWTSPADTLHQLSVVNANAEFHVFTAKSTATIPAISELPLPGNQQFGWTVTDFGGGDDVNAFASATPPLAATAGALTGSPQFSSISTSRTFTSQ